jgi:energy-coupling factor transport system substrate-specific component
MENLEKEKKSKLDTRDLITIGIFAAIYVVIYIAIPTFFYIFGPIGTLLSIPIVSIVNGTVLILLALKVQKFGVFLITGIIFGLVLLLMGAWWAIIGFTVGGLIADMIASRSQYNNKRDIALGYCIFQWIYAFTYYFTYFVFKDLMAQYWFQLGYTPTLQDALDYFAIFSIENLPLVIIANVICPIIGAYIGIKINKKHFEKAGMI